MKDDIVKLTEYDKLSFDGNTQMMKAILPYMPVAIQPSFAYAIIFREFSNLKRNINNEATAELGICSADRSSTLTDILKDIKQYANEKQQGFIDMLLNMMQTMSFYQQYMQIFSAASASSNDSFDMSIDKIFQQLSSEKMSAFNESPNITN